MKPSVTWGQLPLLDPPTYDEDKDVLTRQSLINDAQLCGQRVAQRGLDGYLEAVSESLCFGTCLHHIIAQDMIHGERMHDMLIDPAAWIEPILNTEYDWTLSKVPKPKQWFAEIAKGYRTWVTDVRPTLPTSLVSVEETMELYLGESNKGAGVFLQGTADLVTEESIIDWKSTGRKWKDSKAQFSIQPTLYPALVKQATGVSVRKFTFWVYVRTKKSPYWEPYKTSRRVREINTGLRIAHEYGLAFEADILPATPLDENYSEYKRGWYCSAQYCGAWNVCDYKALADDVDITQVAIRSWN